MPWEVRSLMSERQLFCQQSLESGINFSVLCKRYGISHKTGYKWKKRYFDKGDDGLIEVSRSPHTAPNRTGQELENIVVHLHHQYPYWDSRKLHALMKAGLPSVSCPSSTTVYRILKRHRYFTFIFDLAV